MVDWKKIIGNTIPEIGERVTVRADLIGRSYQGIGVISPMKEFIGRVLTIESMSIRPGSTIPCSIRLNEVGWNWSPLMFEEYKHMENA